MSLSLKNLNRGLLGDLGQLAPPQDDHHERANYCKKWGVKTASFALAAASIAVRFANFNRWTNLSVDISAGYFGMKAISYGLKGATMQRVRKVGLAVLGQTTLFALSQLYGNTKGGTQKFCAHTVIGLLGANIEIIESWFRKEKASGETQALEGGLEGRLVNIRYIDSLKTNSAKIVASIGLGVMAFFVKNLVIKGVCSFISPFYASQILSEFCIKKVNEKIDRQENVSNELVDQPGRTHWRTLKIAGIALANIALPLCLVPWSANPDTVQRIKQLSLFGALIGFFSGWLEENEKERIEKLPIKSISEFNKIPPLDQARRSQWLLHKIWRVAYPTFLAAAMIGFTISQLIQLEDLDSRLIIALTCVGFLASMGSFKWVNHRFELNQRQSFIDKAMMNLWVSLRFFGINPLFLYFMGSNILRMDNKAVQSDHSFLPLTTTFISWFCYAIAMGNEFERTSSDFIGGPQLSMPLMLFSNAATTAKLYLSGFVK